MRTAATLAAVGACVALRAYGAPATEILHVNAERQYDASWHPSNVSSVAELDALLDAETPADAFDHGKAAYLVALIGDYESANDEHGVEHRRDTVCGITFHPIIMRNTQRFHHSRFLKTMVLYRTNFAREDREGEFIEIIQRVSPVLGYDERFSKPQACAMFLVGPGAGLGGALEVEKASQGLGWNRAARRRITDHLQPLRRASGIRVHNDAAEPRVLLWYDVGEEGGSHKAQAVHVIPPGGQHVLSSWVGHVFVVEKEHDHGPLEESKDIVGFFVVSRAREAFRIADDMLQSCAGDIQAHDPHVRQLIADPDTDADELAGLLLQEFTYALNMEKRLALSDVQTHYTPAITEEGFLKMRAPAQLFQEVQNWYRASHESRKRVEHDGGPLYNQRVTPTYHTPLPGPLRSRIFTELREEMEDWAGGMELEGTSCYGVRTYSNGSYLHLHVDTADTHVISGILNVDQDVDEPWPLEILDHGGKLHAVNMEPGDLVLYESARLLHGRPHALNGRSYANVFVHYKPSTGWHVHF